MDPSLFSGFVSFWENRMFFRICVVLVVLLVFIPWITGFLLLLDPFVPGNPFAGESGTPAIAGVVLLGFYTPLLVMMVKARVRNL